MLRDRESRGEVPRVRLHRTSRVSRTSWHNQVALDGEKFFVCCPVRSTEFTARALDIVEFSSEKGACSSRKMADDGEWSDLNPGDFEPQPFEPGEIKRAAFSNRDQPMRYSDIA